MRAIDSYSASNIAAPTAAFGLAGGLYGIDYMGTSWGTVTLQKLAGDGTTYVTAATAFAANGYVTINLAPGTYKLAVSSTTAVYVQIVRIPGE